MSAAGIAPFWSPRDGMLTVVATGDGLRADGIRAGNKLTVDRAVQPADGDIVLVWLDGSFQLGKLIDRNGEFAILSASDERRPVRTDEREFFIEGVCRAPIGTTAADRAY